MKIQEFVDLVTDVSRRDLTINSIAYDEETKTFVDPFGGMNDIRNKILRHTSNAFEEDPVRVLRVARFCARFGSDWQIAEETKVLIAKMAKSGILGVKANERV